MTGSRIHPGAGGYFYAPTSKIDSGSIELPPDETHHARRVMRLTPGDQLIVVDGEGGWYRSQIEEMSGSSLIASILEERREQGEPDFFMTLIVGLPKKSAKLEMVIEKGVELGVSRIVPLVSERTEGRRLNRDRCRRISIAAMKQSLRSRVPVLETPSTIGDLKRQLGDDPVFVAHEGVAHGATMLQHAETLRRVKRCVLVVGPEGGFSPSEVSDFEEASWKLVSLGPGRLRTETACVAAAATAAMLMVSEQVF